MNSLLLDRTTWDLCKDAGRNIAMCEEPYSLAQDAACAIRLFQGELYYDTTQGVPYFAQMLGQQPSIPLIKKLYVTAAETVPDVAEAKVFVTGVVGRQLGGQVQVTGADGTTAAAEF
jgi:hypothetical protein